MIKDMSQMALARALSDATGRSYHQTTVTKLENGSRPTSVEEVYVLAALLDVAVADLLSDDVDRQVVQLSAQVTLRAREAAESAKRLREAKQRYAALTSHGELTATVEPVRKDK
jgi:transcriptional regulator with XRE-family HTH domain